MSEKSSSPLTRRSLLKAGFGVAAAAAAGVAGIVRADAPAKIAQSMVMYQGQPKDGHQCSMCLQFMPPDSCKVVDGKISPNGWCAAFAPKA